jgi:hydrogenase maturation protein HypF
MKNTVALAWGRRVVVSPHVGELDSPRSVEVFENTISMLCDLYQVEYELIAHDLHPGYRSTRWALAQADARGIATRSVLHHAAHAAMLAGAYPDEARWLVFTWDGTGLGADRSIWGGEALLGRPGDWRRVASLRPFRLPGGDRAGREPWRSAAALNWELGYPWRPSSVDAELARVAWQRGMNVPVSSAAGRLFDAAAAMLGLIERGSFEGQAPMLLEAAAGDLQAEPLALPLTESEEGLLRTDWAPLIDYLRGARDPAVGAAVTHASLAASLCAQALALRERHGDFAVGLSGGVFQNRRLAETALTALAQAGLRAYLPVDIPYNDAGLSYGQIIDTLPHTETVSTA